ncbi:hypothetical protein TWF694_005087 [Orbilia ellipsospora]|uniref:Uncharacterized protein n=1 Tax=Orbilia ellipsospora TaxID=2528407 RepID=A0AAV9WW47_9PEZI
MAQEQPPSQGPLSTPSQPPPPLSRRPTDLEANSSLRPTLNRKPSDLLPPPAKGQFTPELSPLDAFVSRGRQLYRQLELEEAARKRTGGSKSPDVASNNNSQTSLSSQPSSQQFLQQPPPKFSRSHSAGSGTPNASAADQQLGVGTLNAAVEQWAIGNSKSVTGGDRATRLFSGGRPSPLSNGAGGKMIPQVAITPNNPGYHPGPRTAPLPGQPHQTSFSIKEPNFRPVSQHPRISGIGFEDDMAAPSQLPPRGMQQIAVDRRGSSVNRSTASSPRSPRMPFTSDDDSSDEEEERMRRRRESARRRDLERRRPVSTGRRMMDPSPVREEGEPVPVGIRNSLSGTGGLPQRSFSGTSPSLKPMDAVEQARKGSLDSNSARGSVTLTSPPNITTTSAPTNQMNTISQQMRTPTPPLTVHPARTFPQSPPQPQHSRRTSGLAAPSLPLASTSTPNLLLRSHTADGVMTPSPRTPQAPSTPSIAGLVGENRDREDDSLFLPPQPAFAKSAPNTPRPSSAMSDTASIYSVGGTKRPFNFSRPMSKTSFYDDGVMPPLGRSTSMDVGRPPRRQDSLDYRSFVEEAERNDAAEEENFGDVNMEMRGPSSFQPKHRATGSGMSGRAGPTESYTYSAYALPRGRAVDRSSIIFFDGERHRFDPADEDGIVRVKRTDSNGTENSMSPTSIALPASPFAAMRASQESQRAASFTHHQPPPPPTTLGRSPSSESNSSTLLRPKTSGAAPPKLSPEEHLDVGIPLHEKGSYAESTYHFRLSALGGNTTGMLMYALALRHGWGMRANQSEAFTWLRKAAGLAQEEIANAEKDPSGKKPTWWENKSMRGKFALTTYELGMSYTNGWGCTEDKAVGLKYFEIAASWGDVDALSEAGYAYANGQGCKKDLKKSARYYRQAAENGVSMVGNSWIWKEKYDEEEDKGKKGGKGGKDREKGGEKDKSGLLSFTRKKSINH